MNQQNLKKWLYRTAALFVIAGVAMRFLYPEATGGGLRLILAGLIVILAAIFLQIKQLVEAEKEAEPLQQQTKNQLRPYQNQ